MIIDKVRYFPKFGQILVRCFVKNGSDLGQIFGNFGQIFELSTLVQGKILDFFCFGIFIFLSPMFPWALPPHNSKWFRFYEA